MSYRGRDIAIEKNHQGLSFLFLLSRGRFVITRVQHWLRKILQGLSFLLLMSQGRFDELRTRPTYSKSFKVFIKRPGHDINIAGAVCPTSRGRFEYRGRDKMPRTRHSNPGRDFWQSSKTSFESNLHT